MKLNTRSSVLLACSRHERPRSVKAQGNLRSFVMAFSVCRSPSDLRKTLGRNVLGSNFAQGTARCSRSRQHVYHLDPRTLPRASLPGQLEFEAAVLQKKRNETSPFGRTQPTPPAPTQGLSASRIRRLLRLTWRLAAPLWYSDRTAVWHVLACAVLRVASTSMGAVFTNTSGNMFTALSERNASGFSSSIARAFGLLIVAVPLHALSSFLRSTMKLRWQQFLTKRGLGLYFAEGNYYKLANLTAENQNDKAQKGNPKPDNPDQVIQRQFSAFASSMVDIAMRNLRTVTEVVIYSVMLFRIYPPLYLCILVIVCIGMLLINHIGKHLVELEALLLRRAAVSSTRVPRTVAT